MLSDLNQVQIFKETTWGTSGTPTSLLSGITKFSVKPGVKSARLTDEMRGSLVPSYNAYVKEIMPTFTMEGYLFPEDAPYYFDSLFGLATPTGAGPYVYAYSASTTATSSPRIFSVFYGDAPGTKVHKLTGAIINRITIKGQSGSPWMFTASGIAKQHLSGASFAALSNRTATVATANNTTLYIDALGGTIGSTAIASTAFEFELTLENQRSLDHYIGALAPGGHHENKWDGSLKLHVEYNSTSATLMEDQLVSSPAIQQRLVRLLFDNGGATTASRKIQADFAGTSEETPEVFKDKNGVVTFEWTAKGTYDSGTFAQWAKMSVTNNSSTMV